MSKHLDLLLPFTTSFLLAFLLAISHLHAAQSTIIETEGYACMGDDKSRKQTEQAAVADANRKAAEQAVSYIKSETHIKDMELEKDLVSSYTNGTVKVIQELAKGWYKDASIGDCYKVRIKAEVVPDEKAIKSGAKEKEGIATDDPSMPLKVSVWSDKKEYSQNEKIRIYIKGNKPFYAKVLYKDARGNIVQLLPNPYRTENYFNGGVIYEMPSGNDKFDLEVSPPFGEENIIVYASTAQLGEISLKEAGAVYEVKTRDIGNSTRGVRISGKEGGKGKAAAEFYEGQAGLKTGK